MTGLTVLQQIEISKELGNLFRQCRIEAGDTIEEACVKMGVSAKSVETLEDGRYERWFGKSLGGTIRTFAVYNKKLCFSLSDYDPLAELQRAAQTEELKELLKRMVNNIPS